MTCVRSTLLSPACVLLVLSLGLTACGTKNIPNTRIEDTDENQEIVAFVERYRKAVEARDVAALRHMASQRYFDDMGTPNGDDDVDYDALMVGLTRLGTEIKDARYQISYRGVTYTARERVLVDLLYTGWFKVETPEGPQWRRRLEPHRIVLAREGSDYRILSGM